MARLLTVALVTFLAVQSAAQFLTCFVTPPVRDLKSVKPIDILAVRSEDTSGVDVSITFSSRDDGSIYSNGQIVEFGEQTVNAVLGAGGYDLNAVSAQLSKPEKDYLEPARFGVHYCDQFFPGDGTRSRATLLIYNQRTLIPQNSIRTHVVSSGDTMKLCVDPSLPKTWRGPIEWAFNGEPQSWLKRFTGSTCIRIKDIQTCQAGIYEAYRRICGRRVKQHAFFDVRVRGCPDNLSDPPQCDRACLTCVNGYCDDETGDCICAHGFTGATCDTGVEGHFGSSIDVEFSAVGLDPQGKGSMMCTEDYGCTCPSGWKGIDCDQPCDSLSYGPDCVFPCADGVACNRFTGVESK